MSDRETPSTSWATWAWQAYCDGLLVESDHIAELETPSPEDIALTKALPGFDPDVLLEITGVDLRDTLVAHCEGSEVAFCECDECVCVYEDGYWKGLEEMRATFQQRNCENEDLLIKTLLDCGAAHKHASASYRAQVEAETKLAKAIRELERLGFDFDCIVGRELKGETNE